jgi:hypothetical protein
MNSKLSLTDLQRIAFSKHGEDRAWSMAYLEGNPSHKKTWQAIINQEPQTPEEKLHHQIWQQKIKINPP